MAMFSGAGGGAATEAAATAASWRATAASAPSGATASAAAVNLKVALLPPLLSRTVKSVPAMAFPPPSANGPWAHKSRTSSMVPAGNSAATSAQHAVPQVTSADSSGDARAKTIASPPSWSSRPIISLLPEGCE